MNNEEPKTRGEEASRGAAIERPDLPDRSDLTDLSDPSHISDVPAAFIEAMPDPAEAGAPEAAEDEAQAPADVQDAAAPPAIASREQAKAIIEALLFSSGEPLTARRLANALGDMDSHLVRDLIEELAADCRQDSRGIQVLEVAGGFQLGTKPGHAEWILRLLRHKRRSPLSPAALETLAIIAYKQPIARAEMDAIRGVESSGVVRTLLDMGLVEVKGRKEVIGKPQLYGTTDAFLRAFGLRRLEDLPSIQELRERYNIRTPD